MRGDSNERLSLKSAVPSTSAYCATISSGPSSPPLRADAICTALSCRRAWQHRPATFATLQAGGAALIIMGGLAVVLEIFVAYGERMSRR